MCSRQTNDSRNRERAVLDLFSNFQWVRSKGFFGEPLGHVITLRGQILVSRIGGEPLPPASPTRVSIQNASVCTFKTSRWMPAPRAHEFQDVRVVPVHTGTF